MYDDYLPKPEKPEETRRVFVGPVRNPRNNYAPQTREKHKKRTAVEKSLPVTKSVDFILVYDRSHVDDDAFNKIETFVTNLEQKGFELEAASFSVNKNVNFIKIHAPKRVLLRFAKVFGVELAFRSVQYNVQPSKPNRCMATEVTRPRILGPVYPRAPETLSDEPLKTITSAEKGLIIWKVLRTNFFGDSKHDYGADKLINHAILESAYPLHDGPFEWTEHGPLNDRQLLTKYWSSFNCCYKLQPLDLIEKYFGPETAFYFAWLGFYNKMLVVASVMAVTFFLLGLMVFRRNFELRSKDVCESDLYLCPKCIVSHCNYEPLHSHCLHSQLIYIFDNTFVIIFAGFMSVWSALLLQLWRREQAILQIRWNLTGVQSDYSMRPEFEAGATGQKMCPTTGKLKPYMSKKVLCYRYVITFVVVFLLMFLVVLGLFGVMVYVKTVSVILTKTSLLEDLKVSPGLIASMTGSFLALCFIVLVDVFYGKVAMLLTTMENPRTQVDFDNSFTYKSYAIAFVNNYCVVFYIAFFKTRFYTYPGDKSLWNELGGIRSDLCDPSGCIIELGIQLGIILIGKRILSIVIQYFRPRLQILIKKLQKKKTINLIDLTCQWESDYMLNPTDKYHIMGEYMQMIIQYGYVTFFVAAFPLAPLIALVNNLVELRVDASNLTRAFRRPVGIKVPNIGAWDGILRGVTYIGVATNAFVIAFTSEFVEREIFVRYVSENLEGFVNSTLSAYDVTKFPLTYDKNISECYYPGKRYPPGHENEYRLTDNHFFNLTCRLLVVIVFEHIIMVITGLIANCVPDIPFSVKEHINYEKNKLKEAKLKSLRESLRSPETQKH